MARMLSCLLCLVGLTTSASAQETPQEPARNAKPTTDLKDPSNVRTRFLLRFGDEDGTDRKRTSKASRVGVVIDRRTVTENRAAPGFWIGVQLAPIPTALQAQLGLEKGQGLMIEGVIPGSPAAGKRALRPFDILLEVNGTTVADHDVLTKAVQNSGDQEKPVKLTVIRSGKKTTVEITAAHARTITGKNLEEIEDQLKRQQIEGTVNLDKLKKRIRILTGRDGQRRFELHIDSEGKDGEKGRFTRSIRISPEGIIVTPRQPSTTQKPGQGDQQDASPRFELRFGRSTVDTPADAPADADSLLKKLEAALNRIEQLETTVKKLRKQADKKK